MSITKHNKNSYQIQNFRACEKTSTLLSMSDNYVHCTMLFELTVYYFRARRRSAISLSSVANCFWLSSAVLRRELPCVTMSNFQCFHTSHTNSLDFERSDEIFRRLRLSSSSRTASVSAFVSCLVSLFFCCSF